MTTRNVTVTLFGAFRDYQPEADVCVPVPEAAGVAEVRKALAAHGRAHWPGFDEALLARSVLASETTVLRDGDALPSGGLAILPPVAGG